MGAGYTIEDFFKSCILGDRMLEARTRSVHLVETAAESPQDIIERRQPGMGVPLYQAKAEFFKTLGHPARIRILELLSERDHAVHELLEQIDIEPSNLSQQLAVLRRTSLVVSHREGSEVIYSVSVPEVRDLLLAARSILSGLISSQSGLGVELTPDHGTR